MRSITVEISTTNPDVVQRIKEAIYASGFDLDDSGNTYPATVAVLDADNGEHLYGSVFEPDNEIKEN